MSVQRPLVVARNEGLVDFDRYPGVDVRRRADRTGRSIAERGVDQGVASHQDMEIHPPGEADVLAGHRHVAARVLDADDVVDGGQFQDRGGREGNLGPVGVGVEQDRQVRAGLRNRRIMRDQLLLAGNEKIGGDDGDRADPPVLRHLRRFDRLASGDGAGSRIDGNPATGLVNDNPDGLFFLFEGEGEKFPLASDGEQPMGPAFNQMVGEFSKRAFVDPSLRRDRCDHRGDDPFRYKILHVILLR